MYTPHAVDEYGLRWRAPDGSSHVYTCVDASEVMLADKATAGEVSGGQALLRRLRTASGVAAPGGLNELEAAAAMAQVLGWRPLVFHGSFAQLLARLGPTGGAAVFGRYDGLGADLTRWDRPFAAAKGIHSLYWQPGFLIDPLGRAAAGEAYLGEPVDDAPVERFATLWRGYVTALVVAEGEHATMTEVETVVTLFPARRRIDVVAGGYVAGYRPGQVTPVKAKTWPTASHAWADAVVVRDKRLGVPYGTFYRADPDPAWGGYYAGLLIPSSQVKLGGPLSDPGAAAIAAAREALTTAAAGLTAAADKLGGS